MPGAVFSQFRSNLPPQQRDTLDSLALQLLVALRKPFPVPLLPAWTRQIQQRAPQLAPNECEALAFYAIAAIANGAVDASSGRTQGPSSGSPVSVTHANQAMQETQMSFNLQYLQLQNTMQQDNRQYTAISNIMKTKHDTVKNTISNIH
ncbi:MAG TPA: hypothetical protein VLX67_05700 [Stellaceae bacterium]|nr:hypothetical protein [Stellaceae bacterium]